MKRKVELLLQNLASDSKILVKGVNSVSLMLRWIGDREVCVLEVIIRQISLIMKTLERSPDQGHQVTTYTLLLYRIFHEL